MEQVPSAPIRRSRRVPANIPIKLLTEGGRSKIGREARTVDLSVQGARIQTSFALSAGELIYLVDWGDYGGSTPSRVVWVQQIPSGGSLAGIEFVGESQA